MTFKHNLFFCGQYVTVFGPKDPKQATRLFIKYVANQLGESQVSLGYIYQLTPFYKGPVDGRAYIAFSTLRFFLQLSYNKKFILKCDEFFSQSLPVPPPVVVSHKPENSFSPKYQTTRHVQPRSQSDMTISKWSKQSETVHSKDTNFHHKFTEAVPIITFLLATMGIFGSVAAALI